MTISSMKRYRVLFRQEQFFKVDVAARSDAHAMTFVEDGLERGLDLDATPYGGDFDVVSATRIEDDIPR